MEYFSDFNDIAYNTISNVFFTYITQGTESDPDRYKFLIPKNIPAQGDIPAKKQNFGIWYKFPRKQKDIRYQVLYNLTSFSKDRAKVAGITHECLLTLDIIDKGQLNPDFESQDSSDNSSFLVEIGNQLSKTQFWQQTILLMTDAENRNTPSYNPMLTRDYQVKSLDSFHVGSVRVDDYWKDILNIAITFEYKGLITTQ